MLQVSELHKKAGERLEAASGNPKKIALLHTAITLGVSFLLTVVNYLFSLGIAGTGGLDGLGARSILATAQTMLELAVAVGLPIWQLGIFYTALKWAKSETVTRTDLLHCFRRFGSVLGMLLLRMLLFLSIGIAVIYISTAAFMLTPWATPLLEAYKPFIDQNLTQAQLEALLTPELIATITQAALPLFILCGALYLVVAIPVYYRVRFAEFAVMEGETAARALIRSFTITRKKCMQVFKIDLSFWWFYVLQTLSVALCYLDVALPLVGIQLPIPTVVSALVFFLLGCICQTLLLWQYEAHRVTVYALAYRKLSGADEEDNTLLEG